MRSEYLPDEELGHVMAALMPANRLACRVALATGLRISDVLSLRTAQLGPRMTVRESKTGKRRRVSLPDDLLAALRAQAGPVWVFSGARDPAKHRTRQAVWYDVRRAARAFRLRPHVSPHSMRKVYAVRLLRRSGGCLERVQHALRHSDASVTMIYAMADELYRRKYGGG